MRQIALAFMLVATVACTSLQPVVTQVTPENTLHQEVRLAEAGLRVITEARAIGPAVDTLISQGTLTPQDGLTFVRYERIIARAADNIYTSLEFLERLRKTAEGAVGYAQQVRAQWVEIERNAGEITDAAMSANDGVQSETSRRTISAVLRRLLKTTMALIPAAASVPTGG